MSLRGGVNGRVWRESVWFWFYARTNNGFWRNPALNTAYVQTPLQKRIMAEYHNMCYFLLFVYRIHLIIHYTTFVNMFYFQIKNLMHITNHCLLICVKALIAERQHRLKIIDDDIYIVFDSNIIIKQSY